MTGFNLNRLLEVATTTGVLCSFRPSDVMDFSWNNAASNTCDDPALEVVFDRRGYVGTTVQRIFLHGRDARVVVRALGLFVAADPT